MTCATRACSIIFSSVPFYNVESIRSMGRFCLIPFITSSVLRAIPYGWCPSLFIQHSYIVEAMDGITAIQSCGTSLSTASIDLLVDGWIA